LALVAAVWSATTASAAQSAPARSYIVRYRDAVSVSSINSTTDALQQSLGFRTRFRYHAALRGFAAHLSATQVNALRADPTVAAVEPDGVMHIDSEVPLNSGELTLAGAGPLGLDWTNGGRRIESVESGPLSNPGPFVRQASSVAIAVLDTGAALSHPDLASVQFGTDCVTPGTPTAADGNGHGTHVTGSIGAANQGAGMAGVAPGSTVYAVRVFNASGSGSTSQVICGIDWVAAHAAALNIKVANMSLGGGGTNDNNCGMTDGNMQHTAICGLTSAGVTPVVAAGNSGTDFGPGSSPANFPEVLTVTAMTDTDGRPGGTGPLPCFGGQADDTAATFSNYATTAADEAHTIAAPGVCVVSDAPTRPFTLQGNDTNTNPNYLELSGTSMATPQVAGAVALCLGEAGAPGPCTGLSPAQIVHRMVADAAAHAAADPSYGFTGDPQHPISGKYYGNLAWIPDLPPTASFTPPTGAVATRTVTFSGAAADPDGTIASATWNFGNGTTGNGLTASAVYPAAGSYQVTLTVTDQNGLTTTAHGTVSVALAPSNIALASSRKTAASGKAVVYTAAVTPRLAGGTVRFTDGGKAIARCGAVAVNGSGKARCKQRYKQGGAHAIQATYSGTPAFSGSHSAALTERINATTKVGDLRATLTAPRSASCLSSRSKLRLTLSSTHLKKGASTRFASARVYLDRALEGTTASLPAKLKESLKGKSGPHKLTVKLVLDEGGRTVRRTLTVTFAVC
jgi:subtilisin family serine protease